MALNRSPRPSGPDPAEAAWSKVAHHSNALFEALEALDEAGGACKAASCGRWSPSAHDKAMDSLLAVVEAAEAELGCLELRRRHFPTRGRRLG